MGVVVCGVVRRGSLLARRHFPSCVYVYALCAHVEGVCRLVLACLYVCVCARARTRLI